eukprot:5658774-Amphidinium_carterae.1
MGCEPSRKCFALSWGSHRETAHDSITKGKHRFLQGDNNVRMSHYVLEAFSHTIRTWRPVPPTGLGAVAGAVQPATDQRLSAIVDKA